MYNASFCPCYMNIMRRCFPDYTVCLLSELSEKFFKMHNFLVDFNEIRFRNFSLCILFLNLTCLPQNSPIFNFFNLYKIFDFGFIRFSIQNQKVSPAIFWRIIGSEVLVWLFSSPKMTQIDMRNTSNPVLCNKFRSNCIWIGAYSLVQHSASSVQIVGKNRTVLTAKLLCLLI